MGGASRRGSQASHRCWGSAGVDIAVHHFFGAEMTEDRQGAARTSSPEQRRTQEDST
jgi:hypothetical protein